MRRLRLASLAAAFACGAVPSLAATPPQPRRPATIASASAVSSAASASTAPSTLQLDVRRFTLDNGLRVVMSLDATSPTLAVAVAYDVGGRNEERGRAGFAHLFEHMMFQGSANVPRGEHFKLVTGHGGTLNGNTTSDRTLYFEMLPRSELALALWLEADRMKSLDVSQSNFENQRAVVKEEYRMRVENRPYVPASIRLRELVYQGYWPYEHTAVGTMRDLDAAELAWVRTFHDAYYAPNEAVLAIAGDIDPVEATALVHRYFDGARRQPSAPKYTPGTLAPQPSPRDAVVEDVHAKLPAILYGWATPPSDDKDHDALVFAATLLAGGESSRLYRALVREESIASEVDAGLSDARGPDVFELDVKLSGSGTIEKVERLTLAALRDLAHAGPTDAEMEKLKNQTRHAFLFGLQSNLARAQRLAETELFRGDARLVSGDLARFLAVTKEDVRRVVATYLTAARRSRVEVKPGTLATKSGAKKATDR
jgi:predicted Zn-dependent peptidase